MSKWLAQLVSDKRALNNMNDSPAHSIQNRRKFIDLYSEVQAWLNAPNLNSKESRYRREMLQIRLLMLDKIDEEYYIKRYIKLRTR
ncbi:hypothetical protein AWZ03_004945 [Drosophila navojoa]|uniref:Uncharacterized protein n=1 Tax=Drosophila navojoa TaxID=7232 RepID=A0A484BIE1_DRONA|nr:hypothetical protein AWZ03_004945 [Drosophila navojoa]